MGTPLTAEGAENAETKMAKKKKVTLCELRVLRG
jgi:hypothetical protein